MRGGNVTSSRSGEILFSLAVLATIAFAIAKQTHRVDWSWWWVVSPLWISVTLLVLLLVALLVTGLLSRPKKGTTDGH